MNYRPAKTTNTMKRTNITDEDGSLAGWFCRDSATRWAEGSRWDGQNWIGLGTGSQWEHEALYRTKGGRWIEASWSDWQGSGGTSYIEIGESAATDWLVANEHEIPAELHPRVAAMEM